MPQNEVHDSNPIIISEQANSLRSQIYNLPLATLEGVLYINFTQFNVTIKFCFVLFTCLHPIVLYEFLEAISNLF